MEYEIQLTVYGDWIPFNVEDAIVQSIMMRAIALRRKSGYIVYDFTFE